MVLPAPGVVRRPGARQECAWGSATHVSDELLRRIKAKLIEAARVYRKDKETVDWIVMQDVHDPRAFTIVERFEQESVSCFVFSNPSLLLGEESSFN